MTSPAPQPAYAARGACPALSAPMLTGDGWLSRVAFTDLLTPPALAHLCALAERHGNGLLDITARGSLQFRGLSPDSACRLESDVAQRDLPLREGLAIETSPLGGLDGFEMADPSDIANRVRRHVESLKLHNRLAAKLSVVVDGSGQLQMRDLLADIRLKALRHQGVVVWQLLLGGTQDKALNAGVVSSLNAADVVVALLSTLAESGFSARGRDLDLATVRAICGDLLTREILDDEPDAQASPYGLIDLGNDRFAAGIAPAFGQAHAGDLIRLCEDAEALGMQQVKPAPSHSLLFFGSRDVCNMLLESAARGGFIVAADDPRSSIAVCPGAPACGSALLPARELAAFAAHECADLLDGSFTLHISGCAKGCAHPAPSLIGFSGRTEGMALSVSACVSDGTELMINASDRFAALSRLARLYQNEHKPGENARACLARLGSTRIGAALRQDLL